MISGNRDQIRRFFVAAWRKHREGEDLAPLEHMVATVVARHPEYHRHLGDDEAALMAGTDAQGGQENPFLHLGMHIALEEQLQADRPEGIRQLYQQVVQRLGDLHVAEHRMIECLAHVLRQAQRKGMQPDEEGYLSCLRRLIDNS